MSKKEEEKKGEGDKKKDDAKAMLPADELVCIKMMT